MNEESYFKSAKIVQDAVGVILLKHFGMLPNPRLNEKGKVVMDNPSLKNGIKYDDIENYCKSDWEEFQKLLFEKEKEDTSPDMFSRIKYAWSSSDVKTKLDQILTKIENGNSN